VNAERSPSTLALRGSCLIVQARYAEAESVLRECLSMAGPKAQDGWLRCHATSLLGEAIAAQGRHAEAEPLLVDGFERMPLSRLGAPRRREALERVVNLYEQWGKPEEAAAWRAKR
jgi:hypothetical protein